MKSKWIFIILFLCVLFGCIRFTQKDASTEHVIGNFDYYIRDESQEINNFYDQIIELQNSILNLSANYSDLNNQNELLEKKLDLSYIETVKKSKSVIENTRIFLSNNGIYADTTYYNANDQLMRLIVKYKLDENGNKVFLGHTNEPINK